MTTGSDALDSFQPPNLTQTYGPEIVAQPGEFPNPATIVNEPLPRAWAQGGMIEAVKRCVITGLRQQFNNTSLESTDQQFYIDIEYPTKETEYPGIWVQFSIEKLSRAGLGMETWTQDDGGNWGPIHEWMFTGRITLTTCAITSKDRDRLADVVLANLAYARPPDMVIYNQSTNANQFRGLITALNENPYVKMTLSTDIIQSGGEQATQGTPWAPNILLYENTFAVDCQGQFNLRYSLDGVYTLAEIRPVATIASPHQPYRSPVPPPPYPGRPLSRGGFTAPGSGFVGRGAPSS